MSGFNKILMVSPLPDGSNWVLMDSFDFTDQMDNNVTVPDGFVTDFASIPRPFWIVLPKWGKYGYAAVIHDWLNWDQTNSREYADTVLLQGMRVSDVAPIVQTIIYKAVRLFGSLAWYRNQADREEGYNRIISPLQTQNQKFPRRRGQYSQLSRHVISRFKKRLSKSQADTLR